MLNAVCFPTFFVENAYLVVACGTSQNAKSFELTRQLKAYLITNSNNKTILRFSLKKVCSLPDQFPL